MLSESDSDNEVLYEYAEELAEIQKESATVAEQQIEMTTLFLRFRGRVKARCNDWKPLPIGVGKIL